MIWHVGVAGAPYGIHSKHLAEREGPGTIKPGGYSGTLLQLLLSVIPIQAEYPTISEVHSTQHPKLVLKAQQRRDVSCTFAL
jgi:hypothetical protein